MQSKVPSNEYIITRLNREIHALTEVSKTLTSPLPLPDLLEAIMDKIIGVLDPAEIGALMIWDNTEGVFRARAAFGYDLEILKEITLCTGEAITGKVFDDGAACLLSTADEVAQAMGDMRPENRIILTRSLGSDALPICTIAAPIAVRDEKFGVLVLETLHGPSLFKQEDIPFVQTLADLIALAIDRARLGVKSNAIREAREAERLRSELMATLSHELRMPLTAIKGYSSALLLDEVEWSVEKQREFLNLIDEESDNLQVILTDILDSSLADVDQLTIELQPLRMGQVAREISDEMQRRTDIHNLMVDFPADFPIVEADPHWIRQVFRNVIDNAVKYSPEGGLIVIRGESRSDDVVISVADQGIGISPENLIPSFERYYRAKSPEEFQIAGTGLGLPIARTIVEAHGGRIWAQSKVGQGTTLNFSLPILRKSQAKRQHEAAV